MSAVVELAGVDAGLDESIDVDGLPVVAVADLLVQLERASRALEALRTRAIGRFDAAGGAAGDGYASTAAWLRSRCQLHPGDASARVQLARTLRQLPDTAAALASGRIPLANAVAIASLARDAPIDVMRACEPDMLIAAERLNPVELRRFVGKLRLQYAREAVVRDDRARYDLRQLHLASSFERLHVLQGWLTPDVAVGLRLLLENRLTPPGPDDKRTGPQRMHDAFAAWVAETLATGDLRQDGGERPHVTVVVDERALRDVPGAPPAVLERYGPISSDEARRICCDSKVARVITDGQSEILDVGRYKRTATPAQRRALRVRDGDTCVVPGCSVPIEWCEVHHLIPWAEGGETSLRFLAFVCLDDHHRVHHGRIRLVRTAEGQWEARPP